MDRFDVEYEYTPSYESFDAGIVESPYAPERWDITDIMSSLWKGTGETARVLGRGTGIETLESAGKSIISSEFAKPDESTYFGQDSYTKGILMGAAEATPLTATLAGAGAVGTLAGPIGTVAGLGAVGGALGRGLYLDNIDRYWEEHPDGNLEDAQQYAAMHAGVEALTEVGGAALGFGALKLGGKVAKPFLINAIEKGAISTADVLETVAAKFGTSNFMKRMFGATLPEGGEEVVASYLQHKLDTFYDMKTEAPDYFKTFMIGAVASGPFAVAGAKITGDAQNKIRNNIEKGLQSDTQEERLHMVKQVYDTIEVVSPEAAKNWDSYASVAATQGPISLDGAIDPSLSWKKHLADWQKSRMTAEDLDKITRDPAEILKGRGIPSGTAEMQTTTDPYGKGIAPPEESKIDQLLKKPVSSDYWKEKLTLWKQKEAESEYLKPYSPYSMSAAMGEVESDTNVVPPPPVESEPVVEEKKTLAQKRAAKKAEVVPTVAATPDVVPTTEEVVTDEVEYSKDDLEGIEVEIPLGKDKKTGEVKKKLGVPAYEALEEIRKDEEKWQAVIDTATDSDVAKKAEARLKTISVRRKSVEKQIGQIAKTGTKEDRIKEQMVDHAGVLNDPASTDKQKKKAKAEVERLEGLLQKDASGIAKGATTGLTASGEKQVVQYSDKASDWKPISKDKPNVLVNQNSIIIKNNDNNWTVFQRDEAGKAVLVGRGFKRKSHAIEALRSGQTKEEYYGKNPEASPKPLTDPQRKLVDSIDNLRSFVGSRINKIADLREDPEADGIATDAVFEAASKFKDDKGASFKTFATSIVDSRLKEYNENRYKFETQGVESTDDAGVTTSSLDSATREDVYETPATNVIEKEKAAPPEVTKVDVSSLSPETLARYGQGSVVEKKKTLAEQKAELDARRQSEKASTLEIDAPIVEEGVTPTKEISKKKKVAKPKVDASPVILRRAKAKEAFVDTKKKEEILVTEEVNKAREILDRTRGNKEEAYKVAVYIKDDEFRSKVRAQIEVMNYTNLSSILDPFLKKDKSSKEYQLAAWINKLLLDSGKKNINVIVDPTAEYEQFSHAGNGTVIVKALNTTTVNLHEVMHAITSRELDISPELKARVRTLIDLVEKATIDRSDINIDKGMLKRLRSIEPTSAAFRKEFGNEDLGEHGGILYSLLNEKEFLAQAMNDKAFQNLLMEIEVPKVGLIKSLFDHVVDIFLKIFGKTKIQHNAMKEALQLMAELSRVNLPNGPVVSNKVDGLLVGERSHGIHMGTLLDAQFRDSRGDNMETIRKDTGWYKDIDDKWRYEISDHEAEWLNPWESLETYEAGTEGEFKLFDILIHDKLFEAYPEVRDIMIYKEDLGNEILGEYRPYSKSIAVSNKLNNEEALSTLMHEVQHLIQQKEGFALGGNIESTVVMDNLDSIRSLLISKRDQQIARGSDRNLSNAAEIQELIDEVGFLEENKEEESLVINEDLKYFAYKLIAGEAEARVIQKRMKWDSAKRREISPLEVLDVPADARILAPSDHSVSMSSRAKPPEKTLDERTKVLRDNDVKDTKLGALKNFFTEDMSKAIKGMAMGMTEALRRIDPRLLNYVRKFEMAIINYNVKYQRMADPFVKKFKALSKDDQRMLGLVLLNNFPQDVETRYEILKRNNMVSEYEKVVDILKDIQKRKKMVSLGDYKEIENYFPRTIKDRMGILQAIKGDPNYGIIEAELSEAGLNEADRAKAIEKLLHTGRYPALALMKPGSSKKRSIERVSSEWAHYYENPVDSLLSHIYENNEAIEARNMFGDTRRKDLVAKRDAKMKELEADKLSAGKRKSLVAQIVALENELDVYNTTEGKEAAWNDGIADLLSREGHKYTANQQMEIIALIRARLTQRGMSGAWQVLRNVSLMTALGNPTSAVTQLSDFVLSIHTNGLKNTISSMFGDQVITTQDLDLSHSLREFQSTGSAAVLDKVLKYSGLKYMDLKAKNTFMNAAMKKAKGQTLQQFEKEWGKTLAGDTKQTYEELKEGKNSDRTRFFAFNALSEMQPVSLSEMPVAYLTAGNGRIFYALKSYNIKMINVYARKLFYNFKTAKTKGDKAAAIKDAMSLLILMTLAGAGADELKDLIMNRDVEWNDNVHNNLLKAFMMNQYMLEQGSKKGIAKQMLTDTIIPPTRLYDDIYKDMSNLFDMDPETETTMKFLKSVPWGGIAYAWTTEDANKVNFTNMKSGISKDLKGGASIGDIRSRMLKYNKWAKKSGEALITYSTLKNMKKKGGVRKN